MHFLYNNNKMNLLQFSFIPQTPAEDAVYQLTQLLREKSFMSQNILVSLDIQGAFDHLRWSQVISQLIEKSVPVPYVSLIQSYFRERNVEVWIEGQKIKRKMFRGCIQGSVLGPLVWEIPLGELLPRSLSPLVREIQKSIFALQNSHRSIQLKWIKSRSSDRGNDEANTIAKDGTTLSQSDCSHLPLLKLRREIKEKYTSIFASSIANESGGTTTRQLIPDLRKFIDHRMKIAYNETWTHLLSRLGPMQGYLHRFKLREDGKCSCDQDETQNSIYLLYTHVLLRTSSRPDAICSDLLISSQ